MIRVVIVAVVAIVVAEVVVVVVVVLLLAVVVVLVVVDVVMWEASLPITIVMLETCNLYNLHLKGAQVERGDVAIRTPGACRFSSLHVQGAQACPGRAG